MDVRIELVEAKQKEFRPEAHTIIEATWERLLAQRPGLFSAVLLRHVESVDSSDGVVLRAVADVEYKQVVGLRHKKGFEPRTIDPADVFKVLSVYGFTRTSDGNIVLMHRDCGDWGIALDMSGGFIQARHGYVHVADFVRQRVADDFEISPENIIGATYLGAVSFPEILEHMSIFCVDISLTFEQLREAAPCAIECLPPTYDVTKHDSYFSTRIHFALARVAAEFLPRL